MNVGTGIASRPAWDDRDSAMMYDMTTASLRTAIHAADLPWRLASPSAWAPERTRLWQSADGTVVAWAVLQFPWNGLDYEIQPDARSDELEVSILD